jgi:hypothetical protein
MTEKKAIAAWAGLRSDEEPGILNGPFAEMAHVGIERLAARHRQHHRAQRHEGDPGRTQEHFQRIYRIDRLQDHRGLQQRGQAETAQGNEPYHHDRAEQPPDLVGAAALEGEQPDQDRQRHRHHQGRKLRRLHLHAFDGRQHRDGRGQHAIAIEQRQADNGADADQALEPA